MAFWKKPTQPPIAQNKTEDSTLTEIKDSNVVKKENSVMEVYDDSEVSQLGEPETEVQQQEVPTGTELTVDEDVVLAQLEKQKEKLLAAKAEKERQKKLEAERAAVNTNPVANQLVLVNEFELLRLIYDKLSVIEMRLQYLEGE